MSKLYEAKHHVNVKLDMDEMDLTAAESKATYEEIKKDVAEHNDGMKVSTKEYLDFVMEQLSGLDELSSRAMMGEYILYYRGRIFGGIYDDRLLVKPVSMALRLMPDAEMEPPYNGAKEMILVDNVDDRQFLCELVESMWEELPEKKKKNIQ